MLNYAILFLILAALSGVLGFGANSTQATIAKVCFGSFLALFVVALIAAICRRNDPDRQ